MCHKRTQHAMISSPEFSEILSRPQCPDITQYQQNDKHVHWTLSSIACLDVWQCRRSCCNVLEHERYVCESTELQEEAEERHQGRFLERKFKIDIMQLLTNLYICYFVG